MNSMRAALKRVAPILFLGALPVVVLVGGAYEFNHTGNLATDFRLELYPEAVRVLHWSNPFPPPHSDFSSGPNQVFPVAAALLVAPLTALSAHWAAGVAVVFLLALLAATLWVLDVRDWRVYGVVALWGPSLAGLQSGNLTIVLTFLVALAWRWRERRWSPGVAIGLAVALKLFLWPLLVWLIAIRRYRAAASAATIGLVGGVFLVLPFISLADYVRLLDGMSRVFGPRSYNVIGLLQLSHTASMHTAVLVTEVTGLAVLVCAYRRRSLPLALAASLLLSPIVWTHYFELLIVPVAIRWPRLAPIWFLPLVMVVCPGTWLDVQLWHVVVGLAVLLVITAFAERSPRDSTRLKRWNGFRLQEASSAE
jgi:hypothetical protein